MSAVREETLRSEYPRYYEWITANNCKRLRDLLHKLGYTTKARIDLRLGDMWLVATQSESDIARFERELASDLDAGSGYVWTSLVFQGGVFFRREAVRERLVTFVKITVAEAWAKAKLLDFTAPPNSKAGQRLEERPSEVPENAVPLLQALSDKDQAIFYLGYVKRLRWRDVGDAVGLSATNANNRGQWIIRKCNETVGNGIPLEQLPRDDALKDEFSEDSRRRRVPWDYEGPGARVAISNAAANALTSADLTSDGGEKRQ